MTPKAAASLLAAVTLAAAAPAALACSCLDLSPEEALDQADAAFVGPLLSKRILSTQSNRAVATFRVEEEVKGNLPAVVLVYASAQSSTCALRGRTGARTGLLLHRARGKWRSGSCSELQPAALRAAAAPGIRLGTRWLVLSGAALALLVAATVLAAPRRLRPSRG